MTQQEREQRDQEFIAEITHLVNIYNKTMKRAVIEHINISYKPGLEIDEINGINIQNRPNARAAKETFDEFLDRELKQIA